MIQNQFSPVVDTGEVTRAADTRVMMMSVGLDPKTQKAALEGVMPWLALAGLAAEALARLDRPLMAWMQDPVSPVQRPGDAG